MQKVNTWGDRFALIDYFKPTDDQIISVFGITKNQLSAARAMHATGTIIANPKIDPSKYTEMFRPNRNSTPTVAPTLPQRFQSTVPHTAPTVHQPKKGRSGSKILTALRAVPTIPVPVDTFAANYGVSVAVLRQSKRFVAQMTQPEQESLGCINVKQDKDTKKLMIWRS